MCLARSRISFLILCAALVLTYIFSIQTALPALAQPDQHHQPAAEESIYLKWEEVSSLRSQGQFTAAIAVLDEIIDDAAVSDEVLRRAYNDLVFTYFLNGDAAGARTQGRNALNRFPGLTADPVAFPPQVNQTYNELRREMFGSVTVTKPEEAQVVLNGEIRGETPLYLDLLPVGEHRLTLIKSGYHDYNETIAVDPNGRHVYEISMDRDRGAVWWVARGAVVVGVGVLVGVLASSGQDETALVALGDPPPPPPR